MATRYHPTQPHDAIYASLDTNPDIAEAVYFAHDLTGSVAILCGALQDSGADDNGDNVLVTGLDRPSGRRVAVVVIPVYTVENQPPAHCREWETVWLETGCEHYINALIAHHDLGTRTAEALRHWISSADHAPWLAWDVFTDNGGEHRIAGLEYRFTIGAAAKVTSRGAVSLLLADAHRCARIAAEESVLA